ncbi:MAG TPA: FAD:protein FMN transferase [Dysgonamonadaceae bacterium]|nr:FAD:protein FMN transferase [Dysgonamonadaceae bacterium]
MSKNNMNAKNKITIPILCCLVLVLSGCNQTGKKNRNKAHYTYLQEYGEIFHTSFHVKYAYDRSLYDEIMDELHKFDDSLNPFNEHSIISKINRNEPVQPDSFFVAVFNKAMEVSRITDGKFDITVAPLVNAWGFGFKNSDNITPELIDSLKQVVGYEKVRLENGKIVKADPRVQLDASAIAKGYACDVVADLLRSYGVEDYMIEIGGEIAMHGKNDKGVCWRIGIDKPMDDSTGLHHELQTILSICDQCVATSGNYRNYYVKDGKKYAHTIDPQTGYPSEQDILSATVIADDCMTADAYATAFMASGMEKSKEIAKKVPGLFYYFIYAQPDGTMATTYSAGFEQFFAEGKEAEI